MSEYAPTTKDVREVWIEAQDITHDEGDDFHGAEFDRWLAAHDAEVRAGVEAEELEWEKRYEHLKKHAAVAMVTLNGDPYGYRSPSNREAAELLASGLGVPVKQEGAGQ